MRIVIPIFILAAFGFLLTPPSFSQRPSRTPAVAVAAADVSSTPAFAELLLRRVELEAELEGLILEYTDEFPRVVNLRHEVGLLNAELENLRKTPADQTGRLTLALGKLLVKRSEFSTDLWVLLKSYKEEHPDVKRAQRKIEIYSNAIESILK